MSAPVFPFRRRWALNDTVWHVAANRRGTAFVMALEGGFVFLATDDSGQDPLPLVSGQGRCLCLAPDADEHAFLAGSADGCLSIVEAGVPVPTVLAHFLGESVSCVASSPQGGRACACGAALHRFDPEGQEIGGKILFPAQVKALVFSPDGETLAVAHERGIVLIEADKVNAPPGPGVDLEGLCVVAWSPDGVALFALGAQNLYRWNFKTRDHFPLVDTELLDGLNREAAALRFSNDGRLFFVQGLTQAAGRNVAPAERNKAPILLTEAEMGTVTALVPHPKDSLAAIGYENGALLLSPFDGRKEILLFPPTGFPVVGLAWSREGDCLHAVLRNGLIFLFTLSSVLRFQRHSHAP